MGTPNHVISFEAALTKAMKYCAYQERCPQEIHRKAREWGIGADQLEELMLRLEKENFLSEERFVEAFVNGKFRLKHWGKMKLRRELQAKGIQDKWIEKYLDRFA